MNDLSEPVTRKTAFISPCGMYRYRLERFWSGEHALPFVMLNPSTADANIDDATVRRCMAFARRERAGGIVVCNMYAFRATRLVALWRALDPDGPKNDAALQDLAAWAVRANMPIVCGWGVHGRDQDRVVALLRHAGARLVCLGRTKNGHPRHPLYVRKDQPLEPFP